MHTTEGAQEIAYCCPHPFSCVDMHFANPVAAIVPCPFLLTVTDCRVYVNDVIVALPFVGEYHSIGQGEGVDVVNQGLFVRVVNHPQAHPPAFTADCADNRRPVIVIAAVSKPFVGSSAWWIIGVSVKFTFSPAF
jgi:hypothetical protein